MDAHSGYMDSNGSCPSPGSSLVCLEPSPGASEGTEEEVRAEAIEDGPMVVPPRPARRLGECGKTQCDIFWASRTVLTSFSCTLE